MNNVLQALIHFFKQVGTGQSPPLDQKTLVAELDQFGLSLADLESTLADMAVWIASKQLPSITPSSGEPSQTSLANYAIQPHQGVRVYVPYECERISKKSRGFLTQLAQVGMLSAQARESIIDQLMQIDAEEPVRLSHTRWVTFQTLFHDAPADHLAYLEWLLFAKVVDTH